MKPTPFPCPACGTPAPTQHGGSTYTTTGKRRVRECPECGLRFTTYQAKDTPETFGLVLQKPVKKLTSGAAVKELRRELCYEMFTDIQLLQHITGPTRELAARVREMKAV